MIAVLNMASKRPANVNVISESKVSHKNITLEQKMKVIRRFNSGDRAVDIACDMALALIMVRTIFFNLRTKLELVAKM